MKFICPTCGEEISRELKAIIPHTEKHIIDEIKKRHPGWIEKNGVCRRCYEFYKNEMHKE